MMTAAHHRLDGLEPDNLLAFLALLGTLRALDTARPDWHARVFWDLETPPLRPVLVLSSSADKDAIASATSAGAATLSTPHKFDRVDLAFSVSDAAVVLQKAESDPLTTALFDALMSDGASRDEKGVWPTPLCFLFGQGHQHFLSRLADIPAGRLPPRLANTRKPPDLNAPRFVSDALFLPWTRLDLTDGFRWDPLEDRRYALRADDPSGDPAGMQHGANRLAAIGLPALPGAVIRRRGETRFLNAATSYGSDGAIQITWPIWNRPARLCAIIALLSHPALAADTSEPLRALGPIGVAFAYRARRISVGKFFNVTSAERFG